MTCCREATAAAPPDAAGLGRVRDCLGEALRHAAEGRPWQPSCETGPETAAEAAAILRACSEAWDLSAWADYRARHAAGTISLAGADLRELFLEGVDLSGLDLAGANLSGAQLQNASLERATLAGATLERANLLRAELSNADLTGAKLRGAILEEANLWQGRLENADASEVVFRGARLWQARLAGADLSGADCRNADLSKADLARARLSAAGFTGARLDHADLTEADFENALLHGTNFHMALLTGALLLTPQANVDDATDFVGANLDAARLEPDLRTRLEANIRRRYWETWYATRPRLAGPVRAFWWISDYGTSTQRLLGTFLAATLLFTAVYALNPWLIEGLRPPLEGAGGPVWSAAALGVRSFYFSIVTMTTLGFGEMHAAPATLLSYAVLIPHILVGYLLLASLVTRMAILFQSVAP
jgi:uncharacterized protein YjbI with pentapeptide repeats